MKPQLKKNDDPPPTSFTDDYAPKKYSAREHMMMGLKIFVTLGILLGLLWLVDAVNGV